MSFGVNHPLGCVTSTEAFGVPNSGISMGCPVRFDENCSLSPRAVVPGKKLTSSKTDLRKAGAKKAGDRAGARNGIRSREFVVGF
jgi:hypothetical protein